MTVYNGRRGRTLLILNLSTRLKRMANTSAVLPPVRNIPYQLSRRPGESRSQFGRGGEEKKFLAQPGIQWLTICRRCEKSI